MADLKNPSSFLPSGTSASSLSAQEWLDANGPHSIERDISSANDLEASKYSKFLKTRSVEETLNPWKYNKRANDYVNEVLDRQYEMDVRKHQEELENSAYQRSVEDMKKAGLNPYWMFNNSAGQVASSDTIDATKRSGSSSKEYSNKHRDASEIFKALIKIVGTAAIMSMLG